jgi:hypothetical protein
VKRLSEQTLYEILEVPPDASTDAIAAAVERARMLYGPGSLATYTLMTPEESALLARRIEEARETLLDPELRPLYDEEITQARSPHNGAAHTPPPAPWPPPPVFPPVRAMPPFEAPEAEDDEDDEDDEREATETAAAPDAVAPGNQPEAGRPVAPAPEAPAELVAAPSPAEAASPAPASAEPTPAAPEVPPPLAAEAPAPAEAARVEPTPAPFEPPPTPAAAEAPAAVEAPAPPPPAPPIPPARPAPIPIQLSREVTVPAATPPPIPSAAPTPVPLHPPPALPPMPVPDQTLWTGEVLRQIREARGITLPQLAERTKVTRHHIENIEADRYGLLPAPVYLRGILMSLARELRLDGQKVARSYLERFTAGAPPPSGPGRTR